MVDINKLKIGDRLYLNTKNYLYKSGGDNRVVVESISIVCKDVKVRLMHNNLAFDVTPNELSWARTLISEVGWDHTEDKPKKKWIEDVRRFKEGTKVAITNPDSNAYGDICEVVCSNIDNTYTVKFPNGGFGTYCAENLVTCEFVEDLKKKSRVLYVSKFLSNITYRKGVPSIKRVIFNVPATIILWSDDTKTVVKCAEDAIFDEYTGFCAAVCKKLFGTNSDIKRIIKEASL